MKRTRVGVSYQIMYDIILKAYVWNFKDMLESCFNLIKMIVLCYGGVRSTHYGHTVSNDMFPTHEQLFPCACVITLFISGSSLTSNVT